MKNTPLCRWEAAFFLFSKEHNVGSTAAVLHKYTHADIYSAMCGDGRGSWQYQYAARMPAVASMSAPSACLATHIFQNAKQDAFKILLGIWNRGYQLLHYPLEHAEESWWGIFGKCKVSTKVETLV
jgi:hypothetical protein